MAYKLLNPFTLVASLLNFCPNASERLCAGSVDYSFRVRQLSEMWKRWGTHDEEDGLSAGGELDCK
jgi:hypothetical protein